MGSLSGFLLGFVGTKRIPHVRPESLCAPLAGRTLESVRTRTLLRIVWTAVLLLAAAPARSELDVQVRGTFVDVRAQRVSLQQVLDMLSQKTGMAIVYDTEPPQDMVSVDLRDVNVRSAVTQLLTGHGLTYALVMDPTGLRVNKLLLTHGGGGAVRASAPPAPQPPPDMMNEQQEYYEEPEPPEPPPPAEQQTPPPTPAPGIGWVPGPATWPGQGIPGIPSMGGPPSSAPANIQQVPPSSEPPPPPQPEGQTPG
jgi:hypothetical protein